MPERKTAEQEAKDVKTFTVVRTVAGLVENPGGADRIGRRDSQMIFGETFEQLERRGQWIYGTSKVDSYKGHIHESAVRPQKHAPTHVIDRVLAHIYAQPDFKMRPLITLSFMSRVFATPETEKNGFVAVPGLGWVFGGHIRKISALKKDADVADAALKFLGCPYLYGGRSALGIDCSGLVQVAASSCGVPCPRDTDQQEKSAGKKIPAGKTKRGDLLFFEGHVAIVIDKKTVLNATARTMDVRIEKLSALTSAYGKVTSARRLV